MDEAHRVDSHLGHGPTLGGWLPDVVVLDERRDLSARITRFGFETFRACGLARYACATTSHTVALTKVVGAPGGGPSAIRSAAARALSSESNNSNECPLSEPSARAQ
jgi:hypothetical protein